ncbi:DUF4383 domain-containing protein [Candidatus Parcubacteria bacterium]|nr:MAG: DUF4383 domain-containing protein [Candidatus Parcubacteria bacterium]
MVQKLAWVFGIVFLLVGVLGFVPGVTSNGMLLGLFEVDVMHNMVHILSGIVALAAAMGAGMYARLYFKVFGVVYGLVAVLGLVMSGNVLGMHMNMLDHVLHIVIAAAAIYIGFVLKDSPMQMSMSSAPEPAPSSMPSSGSTM